VFSFRARNQDVGSDLEIEPPELLVAGDVLRRLAGGSLVNQQEVALDFLRRQVHLGVGVKKSAVAMEDVR
jgi:hypothetical protein